MSTEKQCFTIRASASRLEKGLLAIPQRFKDWFPSEKTQIQVEFDDEGNATGRTFHPYDPVVKESRIFGLGSWFSKRGVVEGDSISISIEDPSKQLYRIALDRYVRQREEQRARHALEVALTDSEAEQEFGALSRATRRRSRELAQEELLRMAQGAARKPSPRVPPSLSERHEGVPSGIRI